MFIIILIVDLYVQREMRCEQGERWRFVEWGLGLSDCSKRKKRMREEEAYKIDFARAFKL